MRADLVAAYRSLTASKTFTAVAVTVLALGIGVTTGIYSVVDAALWRPLPYRDADRLVEVREDHGEHYRPVSPQNFLDWDAQQDVFASLSAVGGRRVTVHEPGTEPEDLRVSRVTADFFDTLAFVPALGRAFVADEEVEGRHLVVVLSHALWQRRYGGDAAILGRGVMLDDERYEVVGVLPAEARFPPRSPAGSDAYVPLVVPQDQRIRVPKAGAWYLSVIGRLKPGVSVEQARAGMAQIGERLQVAHPEWNGTTSVEVRPYAEAVVSGFSRSWYGLLLGAAGSVLLIACVNVAMLQLARGVARAHEMGVRASLGGGRWRLARQLLIENVVLSLVSSAAATLVAIWSVALFKMNSPGGASRLDDASLDVRALGVMLVTAAAVGIAVGSAPIAQMSAARPWRGVTAAAPTVAGRTHRRVARGFLLAEGALVVALLTTTALFVRSFQAVAAVDLGFDPSGVLKMEVTAPRGGRPIDGQARGAVDPRAVSDTAIASFLARVQELPGLTDVAFSAPGFPMGGSGASTAVEVPGRQLGEDNWATIRHVTRDYHRTLRIALIEGRAFTTDDQRHGALVTILGRTAARKFFGNESPLGKSIVVDGEARVVVGVARDTRHNVEEELVQEVAVPIRAARVSWRGLSGQLAVKGSADRDAAVRAIRRVVEEVLPGHTLGAVESFDERVAGQTAWRRFAMWLMSLFGVLGLVIAAVGVYGTLAFGVERRTREIGVRLALGAASANVIWLVLLDAAVALCGGIVVGVAISLALSESLRQYVFGVDPRDVVSFVASATVVTVATLAAGLVPVRRALRVNPAESLRAE